MSLKLWIGTNMNNALYFILDYADLRDLEANDNINPAELTDEEVEALLQERRDEFTTWQRLNLI